ncbi:aldo/keto reductase [Caloranaerobacter azorensis H53214]|uniref:Aldo/keto reductase n=1 Tax=Caloranaerobacter azorensis H53214 TaxID=1156417 RepID=A0A096CY06_9FIRM|nr:aldo/keto reductase [Caloranaerobacter azorensis]KGG81469.1 aldo/keto reductase [Caloranaerobacter azorensis H53214]
MEYRNLGKTNIKVSRICFGSLTMGPLQANLPIETGANIIKYAYERGINFLDTAELYDNYEYIKEALKTIPREKYIIATKSYSYSKETAEKSLLNALQKLETDYIDIFLLHEQESEHTIRGHYEAIEYFLKAKEKGLIRAFGISTHRVRAVLDSLKFKEIEVIHPIINKFGLGIQDGSSEEMIDAIRKAYEKGIGIYGMKPLGGGHLINRVEEAFEYVKNIPYLHSIAIGMQSIDEVDANISLLEKGNIPKYLKERLGKKTRRLIVQDWCIGCGKCVKTCKHGGIEIVEGKARAVTDKCIFCGYCAAVCPEFCIKVI